MRVNCLLVAVDRAATDMERAAARSLLNPESQEGGKGMIRLTGTQGDPIWVNQAEIICVSTVYEQPGQERHGQVGSHRAPLLDRPKRVHTAVMLRVGLTVSVQEAVDQVAAAMGESAAGDLVKGE